MFLVDFHMSFRSIYLYRNWDLEAASLCCMFYFSCFGVQQVNVLLSLCCCVVVNDPYLWKLEKSCWEQVWAQCRGAATKVCNHIVVGIYFCHTCLILRRHQNLLVVTCGQEAPTNMNGIRCCTFKMTKLKEMAILLGMITSVCILL